MAPREHHISHDDEGYKVERIDSYYYAYKLTASILKEVDLLNSEMCGPLVRAIVETVNNVQDLRQQTLDNGADGLVGFLFPIASTAGIFLT